MTHPQMQQKENLGVENKFFDANKQEPHRWQTIEQPIVYALAAVSAIVVYVVLLYEENPVSKAYKSSREKLIDIGADGLSSGLLNAIPVENRGLKLVILLVIAACVAKYIHTLAKWLNRAIEFCDRDADIPTALETQSFTKRIDVEEFEAQKMEYTRKQLEKLTGSEEFKRRGGLQRRRTHQEKASHSLVDISRRDICSDEDLDESRQNMSMVHVSGRRLNDSVLEPHNPAKKPGSKRGLTLHLQERISSTKTTALPSADNRQVKRQRSSSASKNNVD